MEQVKNRFLVNQVGFAPNASKNFTYIGKSTKFQINRLQDLILTPVFEAELKLCGEMYRTGDFSSLTEEGIYRISTEEGNSRCFVIAEEVYGTVARVLTNYFLWQRCGDDQGWNGNCHSDDSTILNNGEKRSLSGGHHQSSDLRKWSFGTSIGIAGLAHYALKQTPLWDKGVLGQELWHSAHYFLSLITEEGWLLDCTWVPEEYNEAMAGKGFADYKLGWKRRKYFESPDNEQSHWQVMKVLALTAQYFARTDTAKADKCLAGAEKIWGYMLSSGSKMQDYMLPQYPPLGHDRMSRIYQGFYAGSALRYASLVEAACRLFEVTGDKRYKQAAFESLDLLCELQVGGDVDKNPAAGCFWESHNSDKLANNYYYFYNINIPMAFVDVMEIWPEALESSKWRECMEKIARQHLIMSRLNPFGRVPATWYTEGLDVFEVSAIFSFSSETNSVCEKKEAGFARHHKKSWKVFCEYYSFCYNLDLLAAGVFLSKASKILNNNVYKEIAQRQIDWLLGVNQFDASSVEAVGYNQPHRGIFGEFFPPVPQIPGAVFTGITEESFREQAYGYDCEYDMPMVGWMLYLIGTL